jgi:hypothetical protein
VKHLVSSIFLTSCLWAIANLSDRSQQPQAVAQVSTSSSQVYTFSTPLNPLALRSDIIAVDFKTQISGTR